MLGLVIFVYLLTRKCEEEVKIITNIVTLGIFHHRNHLFMRGTV